MERIWIHLLLLQHLKVKSSPTFCLQKCPMWLSESIYKKLNINQVRDKVQEQERDKKVLKVGLENNIRSLKHLMEHTVVQSPSSENEDYGRKSQDMILLLNWKVWTVSLIKEDPKLNSVNLLTRQPLTVHATNLVEQWKEKGFCRFFCMLNRNTANT